MSKILKSVNFEADQTVDIDTSLVWPDAALPVSKEMSEAVLGAAVIPLDSPALREAQAHIQMLLDQAHLQIENWREEAHRVGWQAGYDEGHQAVENELHQELERARQLAESAVNAHQKYLYDGQREIGRLAVAIAKKIIGKELILEPTAVADIVFHTIEEADVKEGSIRIHPADYEILQSHWQALTELQQPDRKWNLIADKHIDRGGCIIDIAGGTVDGQLSTQFAQIEKALEQIRE